MTPKKKLAPLVAIDFAQSAWAILWAPFFN